MSGYRTVRRGRQQVRVGPWRGDRTVGYLAPLSPPGTLDGPGVAEAMATLAALGYRKALTSALTEAEQTLLVDAGFTVRERLHLLHHDLGSIPPAPDHRLRRGRRRDRRRIIEIDHLAFDGFWRFDQIALTEALDATPIARLRVARRGRDLIGYAVTGRSGHSAFLQRLAVDPAHQGTGVGRALVCDALRWSSRRGATSLAVNTQEGNVAALGLYERLGFRRRSSGLAVLEGVVA